MCTLNGGFWADARGRVGLGSAALTIFVVLASACGSETPREVRVNAADNQAGESSTTAPDGSGSVTSLAGRNVTTQPTSAGRPSGNQPATTQGATRTGGGAVVTVARSGTSVPLPPVATAAAPETTTTTVGLPQTATTATTLPLPQAATTVVPPVEASAIVLPPPATLPDDVSADRLAADRLSRF